MEGGVRVSDVNPRLVYWIVSLYREPYLGKAHRDVLIYLAAACLDYSSGYGYCSEERLVTETGRSIRTVREALELGCETRKLRRLRRGHRLGDGTVLASEWQVIFPPTSTVTSVPVENDASTVTSVPVEKPQPAETDASTGRNRHLNRHAGDPLQKTFYRRPSTESQNLSLTSFAPPLAPLAETENPGSDDGNWTDLLASVYETETDGDGRRRLTMKARRARQEIAIAVPCDYCGARTHERCRPDHGPASGRSHSRRVDSALARYVYPEDTSGSTAT